MKRSVMKHGPSSLSVTLPNKWVKRMGVLPGDQIEFSEDQGSLIISRDSRSALRSYEIRIANHSSSSFVRSILGRYYRMGYSRLVITYSDKSILQLIKKSTQDLLGADLVDVGSNSCTVRIFDLNEDEFDIVKSLIRMVQTIKQMFVMLQEDLSNAQSINGENMEELRMNNWRLKDLILRLTYLSANQELILNISPLVFCLERVSSRLNRFHKKYLKNQKKVSGAIVLNELISKLYDHFGTLEKLMGSEKKIMSNQEKEFREKILDQIVEIFNDLQSKKIDHSFLSIIYYSLDMLDSSISYLAMIKSHQP